MIRHFFTTLLIFTSIFNLIGQSEISFSPPMKIPFYLSGNFGEIRSDHFHSGIDIKTNGSTGVPVNSIADGYISRIKVQANGYGKSVYITHDNGYTSVYGHLDAYREDVAEYVKALQYRKKSYVVDLFPGKDQFPVSDGETIAFSGNTGSSSGPHLHFEVRKTEGQLPTNVLKYGFPVEDHTPPVFFKAFIYARGVDSSVGCESSKVVFELVKTNGYYTLRGDQNPRVYGDIGIGTEVFDFLNGTHNRCGVYSLEMYLDQDLIYKHVMDEVSFSETRYINAHIDYEERINTGTIVHKLFKLPNDRLNIYEHTENNGIISIQDTALHDILIVAKDAAGNKSELKFKIIGTHAIKNPSDSIAGKFTMMPYNVENTYSDSGMKLSIPAYALYEDLKFIYSRMPGFAGLYSDLFYIHKSDVPLHKSFQLSVTPNGLDESLREKSLIVSVDEGLNISSAGGEYKNGMVEVSLNKFGTYSISVDTIAPLIKPVNGSGSNNLSGKKGFYFTITDNLSGIDKYDGYIDNQWVLFEYDLKNNLVFFIFDEKHLKKGADHELELYVSDAKGNVSLFHKSFTW